MYICSYWNAEAFTEEYEQFQRDIQEVQEQESDFQELQEQLNRDQFESMIEYCERVGE